MGMICLLFFTCTLCHTSFFSLAFHFLACHLCHHPLAVSNKLLNLISQQVMGNANSLVQSDDWAALISDAKARNCYMNMDSLPKDFLVSKGVLGKGSSNVRGLKLGGPRHRSFDKHMDSKSRMPSEDDENSGAPVISRNGSYRPFKPAMDSSFDEFDQSGDKSRDAWQYGIQKKQGSSAIVGKRDS